DLMNRYPDYIFGASQPQLYEWMKQYYPALYKKIKARVAEGRWEPVGAMWVEPDCNITGGESLVRQLLYGKRFFKQEFGKEMKILWIPDVFGYSGVLPQLMKKSGVDYFMTQKMSWNIINRIPHHTFFWQGIDGSRVLTHMPPEETYNSSSAPRALMKSEKNFADKSVSDRVLLLFGIGDGGGGPGPEHLERLKREKNLDGLPPCAQEPALKFFKRIEKNQAKYQTWVGELYLERHQGTLTTQARIKRTNRKIEFALRELEYTSILANKLAGLKYPQQELARIWKEVLLYQFHDILPGSSITWVYDECLARYKELFTQIAKLQNQADTALMRLLDTSGISQPILLFNSLSWDRKEWLKLGNKWVKIEIPAMGYAVIDLAKAKTVLPTRTATINNLENEFLTINFAPDGSISSIFDKELQQEILRPGSTGNQLNVYDDTGDAWDFYIGYDEKPPARFMLKSSKVKIDGPKAILHQTYSFRKSKLDQQIILTSSSRRLDFATKVDWQETHKMFRVAFPLSVNAKEATCNIQFGEIKRPTHRNTSWELGMFEIPAQKWIDISQGDYGVALLNDSKYGYKVVDNILDLDLLRSPTYPDPQADKGNHEFIYSLYPHLGNHNVGQVAQAGYELNIPIRVIPIKSHTGNLPSKHSFFTVDAENVVLETVKKAEDSAAMILRLYENRGATTKANLQFNLPIKSVKLVNLMEEESKLLKVTSNAVNLQFHPFEILTLKLESRIEKNKPQRHSVAELHREII
ncbi:MAG: glycoside hydrolase family 38 C-terminal domain-containing protein, partial [bacterium]|nr:glycoside hydrolase family 38 C-terminal domain-containing protein [bacterium]